MQRGPFRNFVACPQIAQYGPSDELLKVLDSNSNPIEQRTYNSMLQVTNKDGYLYYYPASGNNGRITSMTNPATNETVSYGYDSLNRLSAASGSGVAGIVSPWSETYVYDGFGNLLDKNATGGAPQLTQAVNATTNQIIGQSYDYNGNQLSGATYDYENRVMLNSDLYVYGPDNVRVWKARANGTEEIYFYDPAGRRLGVYYVLTYNSSTLFMAATNTSFYFNGELLTTTGRSVTPIDRLGSTYNGAGYFPYGEEYKAGPSDTDKFATYYRDATTGLDYAKNRYYSNTIGRFLTPDPRQRSMNVADPGTFNRYAYVNDNPANQNDPEGLCSVIIGGITQGPQNENAEADFASGIGAISAFPFAGGTIPGGVANVLAQGAGIPTGATLTALEAIALAAQNPGPIDILAFSGGAQAFTAAWGYLNAATQSRIQSITYLDPGVVGSLQGGLSGTDVRVLEDSSDFVNTLLQLAAGSPTNPNPPNAEYVDTGACGHNWACVFEKFSDWLSYMSGCQTGAGGVFGAPTTVSFGGLPNMYTFGAYMMSFYWELPLVPSVTTTITFDWP